MRRPKARRLLLNAALVAAIAALIYVAWLDFVITRRFTDDSWQVPAQVYARPLDLRAGIPLPARALEQELERLGYRKGASARPGTYDRRGARFDLHLRRVRIAKRMREPVRVRIVAGSLGIDAVQDARGRDLPVVQLEPLLIGSLQPVRGEDRIIVPPDELPELLPAALKVIEDRNFDSHAGIDLKGILRAAWVNLRAGQVEQGGSTLTQQLVKSYFVGQPRTFWRKGREAVMAMLLELRYSKKQLLTGYVNEIYLGQDGDRAIHGFGLASRFYFGKPLDELDLAETALLVGIVRGPSYYNPRTQPERATLRRNLVLAKLAELAVVTDAGAAAAAKQPLGVVPRVSRSSHYAYLDLVRRELRRDYGEETLKAPGLQVYTHLDSRTQAAAERAVRDRVSRLDVKDKTRKGALEAALVVTLPASGEVVAMVGGRNEQAAGFNRALDARRPIGSLVKPIVYLAALETGKYHAATILNDGPVEVRFGDGKNWRPQNFDRETLGPLPLVRAIAESRNLPTVQLGLEVGLAPVARKFRTLGLDREPAQVPSLLLGAVEMTPIEVAQVYGTFASGGTHRPLGAIRAVVTADGRLRDGPPRKARVAANPVAVYQLNRMLVEVMVRGTGQSGTARLPAGLVTAGKSGTSSDLRDSWFAGFSGSHAVVAWLGHDGNAPTGLTGSQGALLVWSDVMGATSRISYHAPKPASLDEVWIDYSTGFVPHPDCAATTILVAVPRNVMLEHASDCEVPKIDKLLDRFQEWWQRMTRP